jgi:hypothetical protein
VGEGEHLIKQWLGKLLVTSEVTEIFRRDRLRHFKANATAVVRDLVKRETMFLVHWVVGLLVHASRQRASSKLGAMLGRKGFRQVLSDGRATESTEDGCESKQALHRNILMFEGEIA